MPSIVEFSHLKNLPFKELCAFEAAARLGSFTLAADELCVTGSAVSHRIRHLEEQLGAQLFQRSGNRMSVTAVGITYLDAITKALVGLRAAADTIDATEHKLIRIIVAPMLGTTWLLSRLARYQAQHPDILFEITTVNAADDPLTADCDMIFHYGLQEQMGMRSIEIFTDHLYAVCSPAYLEAHGPFETFEDFLRNDLVRYGLLPWQEWFKSAFGRNHTPLHGCYFDDALTMLEAVACGAGIAVITHVCIAGMLRDRRLVLAHPHVAGTYRYFAGVTSAGAIKPAVQGLFAWMAAEVAHPLTDSIL
jgi:LysR family glycine cleavage system transcriptional activator